MADPIISTATETKIDNAIVSTEPKVLTFIKANYVKVVVVLFIAVCAVLVKKIL